MSKMSPGVRRLAAILELFARQPTRSWSLSEIVAESGISRSTCHALLTGLDHTDLVYRDPSKRYTLGPLALALGAAAQQHWSPFEIIRRELTQLSMDWGVISVTNYRRNNVMLIRDWIDPLRIGKRGLAGTTMPLTPPWGAIFYSWEPRQAQLRWLDAVGGTDAHREGRDQMIQNLSDVRAHGYMCGVLEGAVPTAEGADKRRAYSNRTDHFAFDLKGDTQYRLQFIAAPVCDVHGEVAFAVSVTGFDGPMSGTEIGAKAVELKGVCRKLAEYLERAPKAAPHVPT